MEQNNRSAIAFGAVLALCSILIFGCTGVSFNLGPLSLDTAPPRTGTLLYADQGVTITRDGQKPVLYDSGMEVMTGDIIATTDGQAVIDYADGSAVILNRGTRIQLGSIKLFFGELFARVKSIAKQGGGQVVTNELAASVEGTEYGVRRDVPGAETALGNVQVYVQKGRVLCSPSVHAHWLPITLSENQMFEAAGYRGSPAARAVDARALSRWADDAERRLRKTRAPDNRPSLLVPTSLRSRRVPQHKKENASEMIDG